jgi:hypothetical protein
LSLGGQLTEQDAVSLDVATKKMRIIAGNEKTILPDSDYLLI